MIIFLLQSYCGPHKLKGLKVFQCDTQVAPLRAQFRYHGQTKYDKQMIKIHRPRTTIFFRKYDQRSANFIFLGLVLRIEIG